MFKSRPPLPDFSAPLREPSFYKYGALASLALAGDVTALAQDPVLSLLALGTDAGTVAVYGQEGFRFTIPVTLESRRSSSGGVRYSGGHENGHSGTHGQAQGQIPGQAHGQARTASSPPSPSPGIKFLTFHPGSKLIAIDDHNTLYQYDLGSVTEPALRAEAPLPVREAVSSLGNVTAIETGVSHSFVFLGMADGTLRAWDTKLARLAEWRVPNLWEGHEERLRRSGVDRPKAKS